MLASSRRAILAGGVFFRAFDNSPAIPGPKQFTFSHSVTWGGASYCPFHHFGRRWTSLAWQYMRVTRATALAEASMDAIVGRLRALPQGEQLPVCPSPIFLPPLFFPLFVSV
jgi:hypothetical protein